MPHKQPQKRENTLISGIIAEGSTPHKSITIDTATRSSPFFLQRSQGDHEIKLYNVDVPIANGHEVCVVYGARTGHNTGQALRYINVNMKGAWDLEINQTELVQSTYAPRGVRRLREDIQKYVARI